MDADLGAPNGESEVFELRLRVEASELRHAAIEARQLRIEKLLLDQVKQGQSQGKLLARLSEQLQTLSDRVADLAPASRSSPPKKR